jgi:hypothetical protein
MRKAGDIEVARVVGLERLVGGVDVELGDGNRQAEGGEAIQGGQHARGRDDARAKVPLEADPLDGRAVLLQVSNRVVKVIQVRVVDGGAVERRVIVQEQTRLGSVAFVRRNQSIIASRPNMSIRSWLAYGSLITSHSTNWPRMAPTTPVM